MDRVFTWSFGRNPDSGNVVLSCVFAGVMQESEMESAWGPPWLMPMLKCHYFLCCSVHKDLVKSERNMFCLDCMGDAFCFNCLSHHDKDHRVVQVCLSHY